MNGSDSSFAAFEAGEDTKRRPSLTSTLLSVVVASACLVLILFSTSAKQEPDVPLSSSNPSQRFARFPRGADTTNSPRYRGTTVFVEQPELKAPAGAVFTQSSTMNPLDQSPALAGASSSFVDQQQEMWYQLRRDARQAGENDIFIRGAVDNAILKHDSLTACVAWLVATLLAGEEGSVADWSIVVSQTLVDDKEILDAVVADLSAIVTRDAACDSVIQPLILFKGFKAVTAHRVAHSWWNQGLKLRALTVQSLISRRLSMDLHPAAKIGKGVMFDHGTGTVVGETAEIGDGCSLLHEVTLGGTGKIIGDRHPKLGKNVLVGAGAKILGNIRIGDNAKVGAGSVVTRPVPACSTVVGVPAKVIGKCTDVNAAEEMDVSLEHVADWQI